ncbi:MAG: hypothetical protein J6K20_05275, partial [Thermoguttaceae bacterium]|nr:hypothetical protein [Thermoguttaceae bacterium]
RKSPNAPPEIVPPSSDRKSPNAPPATAPESSDRKSPNAPPETVSEPSDRAARIAAVAPNLRETSRAFDVPLAPATLSAYNVEKRRERCASPLP